MFFSTEKINIFPLNLILCMNPGLRDSGRKRKKGETKTEEEEVEERERSRTAEMRKGDRTS